MNKKAEKSALGIVMNSRVMGRLRLGDEKTSQRPKGRFITVRPGL